MRAFVAYMKAHPWQRRAFTALLSLVIGLGAALLLLPVIRDQLLLRQLGDGDPDVRAHAIERAVQMARRSPGTLETLKNHLDTDSDRQFYSISSALIRLGKFYGQVDARWVDRRRLMELRGNFARPPSIQRLRHSLEVVTLMIFDRRDNEYVRQAVEECVRHRGRAEPNSLIGQNVAVLAGVIGDDRSLAALLSTPVQTWDSRSDPRAERFVGADYHDPNADVPAAAALVVGLAGRRSQIERVESLLSAVDWRARSSACWALAMLDPQRYSPRICRELIDHRYNWQLRDRLLHVMTLLGDDRARRAVREILAEARRQGETPPAMAILAAGRLGMDDGAFRNDVRSTIRGAIDPGRKIAYDQLMAALLVSREQDIPVYREVVGLVEKLWSPSFELAMVEAARLLGTTERPDPNAPADAELLQREARRIQLLRRAMAYEVWPEGVDPNDPNATLADGPLLTPQASAAAAVSLWLLDEGGDFTREVRDVTHIDRPTAADYLTWHLARLDPNRAMAMGTEMLPVPSIHVASDANGPPPVYNENERGAGAMLMALAADSEADRQEATRRILPRVDGDYRLEEFDQAITETYRCALLLLGQQEYRRRVRELLYVHEFPQRRAFTAALASGDARALRWLLWTTLSPTNDIATLLVDRHFDEVIAVCAPSLQRVTPCGREDLKTWQVQILRFDFALRAGSLSTEFPRP